MGSWREIEARLQELLRLRTLPVGFKLCEMAEELDRIEKLRKPPHKVLFCQLITAARTYGMTLGAAAGDFYSPACPGMLGLEKRPEYMMDGKFKSVFWFEDQKDAAECERLFPVIPAGKWKAVALAPLREERFSPDLVLFYGTPSQMILGINGFQWKDYQPFQFFCVGEGACSDFIARSFVEGKPFLSIPCYGERTYGHVAEDELSMAVPAAMMKKLILGLEGLSKRGIRYPIPPTGALADMFPGIPKAYREMWKDRTKGKS